ncbi:hypothetical protein SteCoe_33645 [Stentor coeruleus]|uniref:RBR-type E3 ubiquitin transferase n=1 Tax=Stentor coeruleus TaxID=5963 RepID=A0A1R2AWA9_9CILI|nr:hypothetical protein SteCoe_33645 [Stentor coeruleus]
MVSVSEQDEHLSFIYEIEPAQALHCEICFESFEGSDLLIFSCGHKYCHKCLLEYLAWAKASMKLFPLKCPDSHCTEDIFQNFKHLLPKANYKSLKFIRKNLELIRKKNVIWCSTINCEGYAIVNQKKQSGRCVTCNLIITRHIDHEKEQLKELLSLLQCPKCSSLIYKENFCIQVTCICGTTFCSKCLSTSSNHNVYSCILKPDRRRYPWWFIVILLWAYLLFPFYPAMIMVYYDRNWKSLMVLKGFRFKRIRVILLYVLSPVLYVFLLGYFSILLAEKCLMVLFDNKNIRGFFLALKIALLVLVIPLVFVGVLLACGIGICVLPLFGLYLVALGFFK